MTTELSDLRGEADGLLDGVADGDALDDAACKLIDFAVKASVTSLDAEAIDRAIAGCLAAGIRPAQIQEMLALVSGLGVHSLMVAASRLVALAPAGDLPEISGEAATLWDEFVGQDGYWKAFETEFPGFLEALLRLSPDLFRRFHEYCALPWKSRTVPAMVKELAAMACDATPTHRFAPGFRFHLKNAVRCGAGRVAVMQALDIAAAAPGHPGVA